MDRINRDWSIGEKESGLARLIALSTAGRALCRWLAPDSPYRYGG
jgi:hypothetical protein